MNINRRGFLGLTATAGAFGLTGCQGVPAITSRKSPNGVLRLGVIGFGGQGDYDTREISKHKRVEMAAFCDVDRTILEPMGKRFPSARLYQHWRDMLDHEDLDAVLVATPDHSHALIMEEVMRRGLHLYGQKPLCRTLEENRRLEAMAASSGVVTQLGTDIVPWQCDRYTAELIRSGRIGEIKKVWVFSNTGVYQSLIDRSKPIASATPPPATLDWKAWLEGAPERPYVPNVYHRFRWRAWRDFGSGWLGDMGSHLLSPVWLGMGIGRNVPNWAKADVLDEGWTAEQKKQFLPQVAHVTWEFPGIKSTGGKPFEIEWFDGPKNSKTPIPEKYLPPKRLEELAAKTPYGKLPMQGRVVEGSEGILFSTHFNVDPVILKAGEKEEAFVAKNDGTFQMRMPDMVPVHSHYFDFAECCLDGGTPLSSLNWTTKLTETIIRGNMAIAKPGEKV